jgi:hypothetical protein
MTISKLRLTCKCGNVFDGEIVTHCPVAVAIASMRVVTCPQCGSHEVSLGGGSYDDAPPLSTPIEVRAAWWYERGETGTSSLTIWCAFTDGISPHGQFSYPHDLDDYRRCKQLLDLIPEWRAKLYTVTARFPWWRPFVSLWNAFDSLWAEESSEGTCLKLSFLLGCAAKEADVMRGER